MAEPVQEIADIIEKQENCKIVILLDGFLNLLDIIDTNKTGDLYLPGSDKFIDLAIEKGHVTDTFVVGTNYPVLIIPKNNPKNILPNLKSLADPSLKVTLGNPEITYIGLKTLNILKHANLYNAVMDNILYLTTDTNSVIQSVLSGEADVSLAWKALVLKKEVFKYLDYLPLEDEVVFPETIKLGLLKYSVSKELTKAFINYSLSVKGQEIFRSYGL